MSQHRKANMTSQSAIDLGLRAGLLLKQLFAGPHRNKRIAQRLMISVAMAKQLQAGDGWTVARLNQAIDAFGDEFVRFVFQPQARSFDLQAELAEIRATLAEITQRLDAADGSTVDQCFLVTDGGTLHAAPGGLSDAVRRILGCSPLVEADLLAYGLSMFGWLGIVVRPNRSVRVLYAEGVLDSLAAARCGEWIRSRAAHLSGVGRDVLIDGKWVPTAAAEPLRAAALIESAALLPARPSPWKIDRLPLDDALEYPKFRDLLQAYSNLPKEAWALVDAAHDLGVYATSSVVEVAAEGVISRWVGQRLGLREAQARIGTNIMTRVDTRYADMVVRRCREARLGPTYYELDISIDGEPIKYRSLALPDGGPGATGMVLTSSEILWRERVGTG
jgi:hypothetical protein